MKREEAMKLVENGIAKLNEALQSGRSETLERFLATLARFHNYSFGNAILIWSQKPEATQVAGFHAWSSKYRHRSISTWACRFTSRSPDRVRPPRR